MEVNGVPKCEFSLNRLSFRDSHTKFADGFDPQVKDQELVGSFRIAYQHYSMREVEIGAGERAGQRVASVLYITRFDFRYFAPAENAEPEKGSDFLVEVSAEVVADYFVESLSAITQDRASTWGGRNVLLHAWPYWREFLQTTLLKTGLPLVTLPILPPNFVVPEVKDAESSESAKLEK